MQQTVTEDSVILDGVLLRLAVDGKDDDSGMDTIQLSPVVHIEGALEWISQWKIIHLILKGCSVKVEVGSGILAGLISILTSLK